jgi:hypothetical protein
MRKMKLADALSAGGVPVDDQSTNAPVLSSSDVAAHLDSGGARMREDALSWVLSAMSSGSQGSVPALAGALAVGRRLIAPASLSAERSRESISDAYKRTRDSAKGTVSQAEKVGGLSAAIAGQLPSMAFQAPSAAGRIGVNSLIGLAQRGFGTGGDIAEMGKGALASGGVAGVGEVAGFGLGKLAGWANRGVGEARAATQAGRVKALEKVSNSARGSLGGETSSGARTLEQAQAAASDPDIDPAIKAMAQVFLASPEAKALRNQVLESSIDRGAGQLGRIQTAKQAYVDAARDIPQRAAQEAAQISEPGAVLSNVAGRFARSVGQRAALGVGGSVIGAALGGPVGAGIGALATGIAPGALQMIRNVSKYTPAHEGLYRGIETAAGGAVRASELAAAGIGRTPKPSGNKKQDDDEAVNAWLGSGQ